LSIELHIQPTTAIHFIDLLKKICYYIIDSLDKQYQYLSYRILLYFICRPPKSAETMFLPFEVTAVFNLEVLAAFRLDLKEA
jgi:hypothetical protein